MNEVQNIESHTSWKDNYLVCRFNLDIMENNTDIILV